jgi:hypothetical protein
MVIVRNTSSPSLRQTATVLVVLVAWFALSNHCVLGAACASVAPATKGCPMHMKSSDNAPAKHKGSSHGMPCCMTLRAVTTAKISVATNMFGFVLKQYFLHTMLPEVSQRARPLLALDTGPPAALSFSESVLQRSILAHAPPVLV